MIQNSLAFLNLLDIAFGREINYECVLLDRRRSNSCIQNGCCKACYSKGLRENDVDAPRATMNRAPSATCLHPHFQGWKSIRFTIQHHQRLR